MSFCLPLPGFHSSVKLVVSVYFMAVTLFHTGPLLITVYCHRSCNVMAAAFFSSGSDFVLFLCQMYVNECSVSEFLLLFPLLSSSWVMPLVTLREVNTHTVVFCLSGDPCHGTNPLPPSARAGLSALSASADGFGRAGTHTPALHT